MSKTQLQWTVAGKSGFDDLKLNKEAPIPEIGDKDVLVKFHGASLNFRDTMIVRGTYPFALREGVVPGSDGAGTVEAVGKLVHRFKKGDDVITVFNQGHLAGFVDDYSATTGVGGTVDGSFQQYGAYSEEGLVHMPSNLNFLEAGTLSCAAVTAWNALYGLKSRELLPGDWVLTQGTGGVSIFAVQFAKAAGARVIATTSSPDKGEILKSLGADHVINYREDAKWGETAKKLTGGRGIQHVIETTGPSSWKQSLAAIGWEGVISVIGAVGGGGKAENPPSFMEILTHACIVRGVYVGSREHFEAMNRAIEANNIKPVVDKKVFKLEELKDAYQYLVDQKHFGKLCISFDG